MPKRELAKRYPAGASADSARWCEETIKLLWKNRQRFIAPAEREAAHETYERAKQQYRQIAREAVEAAKVHVQNTIEQAGNRR